MGRGLGDATAAQASKAAPAQASAQAAASSAAASKGSQGLFSPIDQNNLSMLVVKSMYNIIE